MKGQIDELKSTDPIIPHCPVCGSKCCLHYQGTKKYQAIAVFVACSNGLCLYRCGMVFDDPGSTEDAERHRIDVVETHGHIYRVMQERAIE